MDEWQVAIHTGTAYEVEHRLRDGTSGEYRWFFTRGVPFKDSQERAHALMNSNIIGIFVTEEDQIIEANDTFLLR